MTIVEELEETVSALLEEQEKRQQVQDTNDVLTRENKILREENEILKRGIFGRRSERLEPGQLRIFEGEVEEVPVAAPERKRTKAEKKRARGHGRGKFAEHLPRKVIELDVDEEKRICPDCGEEMHAIGEDVSERGHVVPAKIVVHRYVRKKYACSKGHAMVTADAAPGVIEGGKYEASVYAHVATSKYADHMPLHRLEGIFKRRGVQLAKQTMWDMLVRIDELVAQPVLKQMRSELLDEKALHSDETPVTMRVEDGKGSRTCYAWGWRNLRESEASKVLIEFRTNRSREGPINFLGDWSGTLIADGYSGFDEVVRRNGIVRAGCWSHARRKLKEALDTGSHAAARVLLPIQRLFILERAIKLRAERLKWEPDRLVAERGRMRESRSMQLIRTIFARAGDLALDRSTLPKSKLGKALTYLDRQRDPLSAFLENAEIPIHNNDEERDLRHLAIGRKNWMIFASPRGGDVACRLYSLVLSCKQAGADPEAYLEDVLMRVDTTPASEIARLTPWAWAADKAKSAGD